MSNDDMIDQAYATAAQLGDWLSEHYPTDEPDIAVAALTTLKLLHFRLPVPVERNKTDGALSARVLGDWLFNHYPTAEPDIAVAALAVLKRLSAVPVEPDTQRPHKMKVVEGQIEVCDTCINSLGYEVAWQETWHENSVEPEWEYGVTSAANNHRVWVEDSGPVDDLEDGEQRMRRTKCVPAGKWLPVEAIEVDPQSHDSEKRKVMTREQK